MKAQVAHPACGEGQVCDGGPMLDLDIRTRGKSVHFVFQKCFWGIGVTSPLKSFFREFASKSIGLEGVFLW